MQEFIQFIEWSFMLLYVMYLVYKYAAKETPLYIKITCVISWIFSFGTVVIIPMDVYFTYQLKIENDGEYQDTSAFENIRSIWKVYYYVNQLLSWIVLPMIYSYEGAGEFTFQGKIKRSIIENLGFYVVVIILFAFILLYIVIYGTFSLQQLFIFLGALSNSVLLLMVVILLGHGLVSIPKYYWKNRNLEQQLQRCQYLITISVGEKQRTSLQFENAIRTLYYVSQKPSNTQFSQYFQQIFDTIPQDYKEKTYKDNYCQQFTPKNFNMNQILHQFNDMNMNKVISLNLQVKEAYIQLKRANTYYENLLDKCFLVEDLIENKTNFDFQIRSTLWIQNKKQICGPLLDKLYILWHTKLSKYCSYIIGLLTSILSIIVIMCQISTFTDIQELNIISYLLQNFFGFYATQFVVLLFLIYIMVCVYYSLFNLKTFSFLQFYKDQQTDSVALMFGSLNFARASAPICYNFLQIVKLSDTAYQSVMGSMDIVPLFGQANIYLYPIILVILCLVNLFDVYRLCLSELELDDYIFNEEIDFNKIEEGKQILYRSRIDRERKFLSLQSTNLQQLEGYNSIFQSTLHDNEDKKHTINTELDKLLQQAQTQNNIGYTFKI